MSTSEQILTPVGRLVQGSLYEPQTKDAEGRPLMSKDGKNARVNYYFAVAIPKGSEKHWSETDWGQLIYKVALARFPNGPTQSPSFAWKVIDGDSALPNTEGNKPCDCEGFPGNWILKFTSGFAPTITDANGANIISEKDHVKLGYYVQVFGNVTDNDSSQKPGVFLNHTHVAFSAFGEVIKTRLDPKSIGFGQNVALPVGASKTPLAAFVPPAEQSAKLPPAYPEINKPPVAVAPPPARVMLPNANGITYEQYKAANWSDEQLIQHGLMAP